MDTNETPTPGAGAPATRPPIPDTWAARDRLWPMRPRRKIDLWKKDPDPAEEYGVHLMAYQGVLKLNWTAGHLWELCSGENSIRDIADALHRACPDTDLEEIERDTIAFLTDFAMKDLIVLNYDPLGTN